jgi:glycosyltransferase involved in cell wall biosynthesis
VIFCSLLHKQIIYHHHGAEFIQFFQVESGLLKKKLIRWVLRRPSIIIALSDEWKENFKKIDPNLPVQVLANAIALPSLASQPHIHGNNPVKILFMGRIGERKGIHDLISAAEMLAKAGINFQLILGGDGNLEFWQGECAKKNLKDKVVFKGWVFGSRKESLYREADIFVLPSYNEGLPMSVLEAMSYGLPVVATSVGGIPQAVKDGVNGYLVEPGEVKILTEKIGVLIKDDSLRMRFGMNSRRLAEKTFNIETATKKLADIYRKLTMCEH